MLSELDAANWPGEGSFTQIVIDRLRELEAVRSVRVEDAPATRSEADYNFISNEVFVEFTTTTRLEPIKRFGILPATRSVKQKSMTIADLEKSLAALDDIGEPDYADEAMLQYLGAGRVGPRVQRGGTTVA